MPSTHLSLHYHICLQHQRSGADHCRRMARKIARQIRTTRGKGVTPEELIESITSSPFYSG